MSNLYERTDIYDLLENEERHREVRRHWEKVLEGKNIHTMLDVSIGTGNLTLPAAELGVKLSGSDLSSAMLRKCEEKAQAKSLEIDLRESDFRELKQNFSETYDCVASTGNSIPYVTNEEAEAVLEQMDALVKSGGYLYFDMRNWDKILEKRQRFYLYNPVFDGDTRINFLQVWDYNADESMTFHLLYLFEKDGKIFQKEHFEEHYFPIKRLRLLEKLESMGYRKLQVMCYPAYFEEVGPDKADWYCVIAQKE